MKNIEDISLERIHTLQLKAGFVPRKEKSVEDMLFNSNADVMFTRFAYLIAKELQDDHPAE